MDINQEAITHLDTNNNRFINYYLNQQNNQVTHGVSILGYIMINRDQDTTDHNLFINYFAENPTYNNAHFHK